MLQTVIKSMISLLKNKYILVSIAFLVWMLFFDPKDWGTITARTQKLNELKQSEKHLVVQIADTKKELQLLKTDASSIEKYAREKFYMKKDNEDIFIVKMP